MSDATSMHEMIVLVKLVRLTFLLLFIVYGVPFSEWFTWWFSLLRDD